MTTNKTEAKRYNITTDKYDHPVPYETEHGRWVEYSSYKAMQAECESLRKDAEIGRSVREKAYPGASYGCHCDLEDGMQPDGCVIDSNEHLLCNYATRIEVKEQCKYWKIIATDIDTVEKSK